MFREFIFRTTPNRDVNSGKIPREHDTEYKIIENISLKIEEAKKQSNSQFKVENIGEINLYTELEPCFSCDTVFVMFNKKYPQIKITVYYRKKYTEQNSSCKYF